MKKALPWIVMTVGVAIIIMLALGLSLYAQRMEPTERVKSTPCVNGQEYTVHWDMPGLVRVVMKNGSVRLKGTMTLSYSGLEEGISDLFLQPGCSDVRVRDATCTLAGMAEETRYQLKVDMPERFDVGRVYCILVDQDTNNPNRLAVEIKTDVIGYEAE